MTNAPGTDWTAERLRTTFTRFFAERAHTPLPSSGLIPHHPRAPLFTNAGMNQFLPWFLGEEPPAHPRATTAQKCVRIMGKHDDIENIGRSKRHVTFFEMLGNFSFGDYFKRGAIELAWELVTEHLGLDPDQLWATVHHTDDEAAQLWVDLTSIPPERVQRLGQDDDENFWAMGDVGPCGPCSEIFVDRGAAFGDDGGPAHGGEERFLEIWNLVFMQYDRQADGSLPPLPKQNIDTGMGLERTLTLLQGVDSVFETDLFAPLVDAACAATGIPIGRDEETDVSLRILADHARSTTFLINDGVFPSNEDRGYVLRRLIRRAVRRAYSLGVERNVMVPMADAVIERMHGAYPDLRRNADFVRQVLEVEEGRFRSNLHRGLTMLGGALDGGAAEVPGSVAFELHDTFGFPIEVTREVAEERGVAVDEDGFKALMAEQRQRARAAAKKDGGAGPNAEAYRELLEQFGETRFVGDDHDRAVGRVLAVLPDSGGSEGRVEIVLDVTPFYAEGGGQVGDCGQIETETGLALVVDTTRGTQGVTRHHAVVERGTITPGQEAHGHIDVERRNAIRRNHTGTHLLHWALRTVLGDHVKQQGSLVAPEELRFDFSHFSAMTPEEIRRVEELVNAQVLHDDPVTVRELSKAEAEAEGAIAFFGEKYGDIVRVLDAGPTSRELCGGTHVRSLGQIGPVKIVKEESVASNTRRVYALTGTGTLERMRLDDQTLTRAAGLLKAKPDTLPEAIDKLLSERKALQDELKAMKARQVVGEAADLIAAAEADGLDIVVARRDGVEPAGLRQLALAMRDKAPALRAIVIAGTPDGTKVSLVAAVPAGGNAAALLAEPAKLVGGGAGGGGDVAQAGGRDPSGIDAALAKVREILRP
jgi:alanyl-tRNA synthetase